MGESTLVKLVVHFADGSKIGQRSVPPVFVKNKDMLKLGLFFGYKLHQYVRSLSLRSLRIHRIYPADFERHRQILNPDNRGHIALELPSSL